MGVVLNMQIPQETDLEVKEYFANTAKEVADEVFIQKKRELEGKDLMDLGEALIFLKCSEPTLNKWVREGLPKHKNGGTVKYIKQELIDWWATQ